MPDIEKGLSLRPFGGEIDGGPEIEKCPVAHLSRKAAQRSGARAADPTVVEGNCVEPAFREIAREFPVILSRYCGSGSDQNERFCVGCTKMASRQPIAVG